VIPWASVFFNGLWILGLAVLLAGFSYHYWLAHQENRRLIEQLRGSAFRQIFWLGLGLVGVGLLGTSDETWERIVWILFAAYCLFNLILIRTGKR
jgi:cell division protein FtsW (lipid II flippase)